MKEYIKLAWRNLWRNRRRTAITSASILFAVFFALLMRSFQLGFYNQMITNAIESYSGFIQIQHKDYKDDPAFENTFAYTNEIATKLETMQGIKAMVPRVETFALASSGPKTKAALILGIDPEKEKSLSNPEQKLVRFYFSDEVIKRLKKSQTLPGEVTDKLNNLKNKSYSGEDKIPLELALNKIDEESYLPELTKAAAFGGETLKANDDGVLISDRLSKYLKITIGDTLILIGQGYQGATAAGIYPVRGLVKFPNPELDNKLVYMTLKNAQYFANLGDNVTSIAINLEDNSQKNMLATQLKLSDKIDDEMLSVENWTEFNKVLFQQIEGDNQSGKMMLALLYFIIFFGIIGTVLMMIHERNREFGVLVAIGMRKTKLAIIMLIEMVFMGILGVLAGITLSLPILYWLNRYPIHLSGETAVTMEEMGFEAVLPLAWIDTYVIWQGLIVALMVIISCIIPLRKVLRLEPVKALRA